MEDARRVVSIQSPDDDNPFQNMNSALEIVYAC